MDKYEQRRRVLSGLVQRLGRGGIAAISRKTGIKPDYLSRTLYPPGKKGRKRIGEDTLSSLVKAYPDDFAEVRDVAGTDISMPVAPSENRQGYLRIPLLDVAVSAGQGAVVAEYESEVVEYLDVAEWWAQQNLPRNLSTVRVLTARGDSMAPDIQHGDVLFVDTAQHAYDAPGIYVLNWQGRALVKRLVPDLRSNKLAIHSTNPAYPAEMIDGDEIDQLHISGRVAAWWTLRRF